MKFQTGFGAGSQRRRRMNMEHVGIALEIMGKGMGGIFAATIIIMPR